MNVASYVTLGTDRVADALAEAGLAVTLIPHLPIHLRAAKVRVREARPPSDRTTQRLAKVSTLLRVDGLPLRRGKGAVC